MSDTVFDQIEVLGRLAVEATDTPDTAVENIRAIVRAAVEVDGELEVEDSLGMLLYSAIVYAEDRALRGDAPTGPPARG